MNEDIYLSLAIELYEKGQWDKETFVKKVKLYAVEKHIDPSTIDEFIKRVTKEREYNIDEKRKILSMITLDGSELKYGEVAYYMSEDNVEKFYELEEKTLGKDKIAKLLEFKSLIHDIELDEKKESNNGGEEEFVDENETIGENNNHPEETKEVEPTPTPAASTEEYVFAQPVPFLDLTSIIEEEYEPSFDIPETEEEFEEAAETITGAEKDSTVEPVEVSPERLEKLKKSKGKVKNRFLKTAMIVAAVCFLSPIESIGLIGGYCYFAEKIKNGAFNPTNVVGKAVKSAVEKVMYIGMNKDKEKEGGKTR